MEAIRSRPPALVLMPFGDDPRDVSKVARELSVMQPAVPLAAIFRPNGFRDNVSESSVLIDALRAGVRDFLRRPISTTELRTLIDNVTHNSTAEPAFGTQTFGRVISFISNKGGVGKSTMAVNTAVGLALRHPGRVLLIDASLQMGVAAALLLGASAVQIGTGFLRCPEAGIPTAWADAIGSTRPEDTLITRAFSGRPGRSIGTRYARAATTRGAPTPAPYPVQRALTQAMRDQAIKRNDLAGMQAWAGQSAAMAQAQPAESVVNGLWEGARELLG